MTTKTDQEVAEEPIRSVFDPLPVSKLGGHFALTCADGVLDKGIGEYVNILRSYGIETIESCQGKDGPDDGHAYKRPCIRFFGGASEGFYALTIATEHDMPVKYLTRDWVINAGEIEESPTWWLEFDYPDNSK